jgi:TonB family protein
MSLSASMITAALLIVGFGITASGSVGVAKPMQEVAKPSGGQETLSTDSPSKPNPDASGVYHAGPGVSVPRVIFSVDPEFTDEARKKKLGGTCIIGMVVDTRGTPQDVHVVRSIAESLAPKFRSAAQGLDKNAVNAAKKFKPAMYQEKAVPYELKVEISYRIY